MQFGLRAQHAIGLNTAQLSLFDLEVARQLSTDHRKRNLQTRTHIRCPADNLKSFDTIGYLANTKLVSVRVLLSGQYLAHNNTAKCTGNRCNTVHFQASHRQTSNQLIAFYLRVNPTTQPLFTEFHPALLKMRYD